MTPFDFDNALQKAYREGLREGAIMAFVLSFVIGVIALMAFAANG